MNNYLYTRLSETLKQLQYIQEYFKAQYITYEQYIALTNSTQFLVAMLVQAIKKEYKVDVIINLDNFTFRVKENFC